MPTGSTATPSSRRSPALAGTLSLVLPGVGSLYATHTGHGIRHLVAIPLLLGATYGCLLIADRYTGGDITAEKAYCLLGGAALYVANDVWSVVTAVRNAKAYNRHSPPRSTGLQPSPQVRVGLLVRLRF